MSNERARKAADHGHWLNAMAAVFQFLESCGIHSQEELAERVKQMQLSRRFAEPAPFSNPKRDGDCANPRCESFSCAKHDSKEPEAGARESQPKNPTDDVYALDKFWEWAEQSGVNGAVRIEHKQRVDEVAVAYAAHCLRQHQEREERLKRALACFDVPEKLGKEWDEAVESAYSVGAMKKLRIAGEHVATWFFNAKQKAAAIRKEVEG